MKVAIVQEQVDVRRGGAETSTVEMAGCLAALGLEVTVVCAQSRDVAMAGNHAGLKFHVMDVPGGSRVSRAGWPTSSEVGDTNSGASNAARCDAPSSLRFHFIDVGSGSRVRKAVRFVSEADWFCRQESFDVVHAVTPCFSCNVYQPRGGTYAETVGRSVARASGPLSRLVKRIGRRFNRRQRFLLLAERRMLTGPDPPFVAAVSEYVARQVRGAFPGYPAERLRVVFNGVDIAPLSADEMRACRAAVRRGIGVDEQTPLVLFVAHNFKLKGLAELLRALAVRSHPGLSPTLERAGHPRSEPGAQATGPSGTTCALRGSNESRSVLVIIGRDSPSPYRRLARRLAVAERVHFLGSRDDIRALYAAADVLAHPTWYDPCSRVVLEALSCGLPVVTTRFNGAAEVIEDGRHGVVIDSPRDAEGLAAAITTCLKPQVREGCRATTGAMRKRLSMARHAQELKVLYEEVAAGKM
ncbi:MAG: glycosyltransferase family 4 protein [Phycisphaerae bacterium]